MQVLRRDYVFSKQSDFDRYFAGEWPAGDATRVEIARCLDLLPRWFEAASARGYHVPVSVLYNVYAALRGRPSLLGPFAGGKQERDRCAAFFQSIAASPIARTLQKMRDSWTEFESFPNDLWQAILHSLRAFDIVSLRKGLYPPELVEGGLQRLASGSLHAEREPSSGSCHPGLRPEAMAGLLPDSAETPTRRHAYLFFLPETTESLPASTDDEALPVDMARIKSCLSPAFCADPDVDPGALDEFVSIKYLRDFRLENDGDLERRVLRAHQVSTPSREPDRRTSSYETLSRDGSVLASEYAKPRKQFKREWLERQLICLTSFKRMRPPIHLDVGVHCITTQADEMRDGPDRFSWGAHIHALSLLISHDLFYFLSKIMPLAVEIQLEVIKRRDDRVWDRLTAKRSLEQLRTIDDVSFDGPFLLEGLGTAGWFSRAGMESLSGIGPSSTRLADIFLDPLRGPSFQVVVAHGDSPDEIPPELPPGSRLLLVNEKQPQLYLAERRRWKEAPLPGKPSKKHSFVFKEMLYRKSIVHAVLGIVERAAMARGR